jgi:hypothetical protein
MSINQAAWITEVKGRPLKVDAAPYTKPGPGQIIIKNAAVAINPVDWKIQVYDQSAMPSHKYILQFIALCVLSHFSFGFVVQLACSNIVNRMWVRYAYIYAPFDSA